MAFKVQNEPATMMVSGPSARLSRICQRDAPKSHCRPTPWAATSRNNRGGSTRFGGRHFGERAHSGMLRSVSAAAGR